MFEVYKKTKNYRPISIFGINDERKVTSSLLGVIRKERGGVFKTFTSWSLIIGGPLFIKPNDGNIVLKGYERKISGDVIYTEIRTLDPKFPDLQFFKDLSFDVNEHLNIFIDLTKPPEQLWSDLSKKRRNGVRRAERKGLNVIEIESLSGVKEMYKVLKDTYSRANVPLSNISLFTSAFKVLHPKGMIKIFGAIYKDEIIGCIILLTYKNRVIDWYAGSLRDYLSLCPNDLLTWYAIKWGSENGFKVFDFGGAGKPNEPYGVREFKKQFGGVMLRCDRYRKIYSRTKMKVATIGLRIYKKIKPVSMG